jgi:hypothetical protein
MSEFLASLIVLWGLPAWGLENDGQWIVTFKASHPPIFQHSVNQLGLFPERVTVEAVDARAAAGEGSNVKAIFVVQFERRPGKHQVFHDRHGWYCADHGPTCPAVQAARSRPR